MKKLMGLGAVLLAGFLVIPGNLGLGGQVLAQSDTKTSGAKQPQDPQPKRQETRQEQEREAPQLQDTGQRDQDATQRQKAADPQHEDLDEEDD
jgi:hypothetical protein